MISIISTTQPAHGGCLPCRISLHNGNDSTPYVTHLEAQQECGRWARCSGHYFTTLTEAVTDFQERCHDLGVQEQNDPTDLVDAVRACLQDLQHYCDHHGPGPDARLDTLRLALRRI